MTFVCCYRRSLIVSATVVFAQAINSPTVVIRTIALVTRTFGGTAVAAENRSARFKISPFGWRDAYATLPSAGPEWEHAAPSKIERPNGDRKCAAQRPSSWPAMQGFLSIGCLAV